jgi:nucleotide-binding universal stress UspA family protein
MFSNIVIGVDGRDGGRDAAALAAELAAKEAVSTLVHACVTDPVPGRGSSVRLMLASDEEVIGLVAQERELSRRPGEMVRLAAISVGAGVESAASARDADLIVVGSCHRGIAGRVLAGDDAASVVHHAHRAVAIAPAEFAAAGHSLRRIGLAYDGSPESRIARACAEVLAHDLGAELVARCVVPPVAYAAGMAPGAVYVEEPEMVVGSRLDELGDLGGLPLDCVLGSVGPSLAAMSDEVDLLVCGLRHHAGLRRAALGSTSGYLAHHASCPLLITGGLPGTGPIAGQARSVPVGSPEP